MIEILTIFVGLYTGPQALELSVGPEVHAVELRLDGNKVGRIEAAPWKAPVDLGEALAPHHLKALALDSRGRELDRSERWINLSRGTYGARLELLGDEPGQPEAVGVVWESLGRRRPRQLLVRFDGVEIPAPDPRRVELPAYDANLLHVVEADLYFGPQDVTRIQATFGGFLGAALEAELSSVVVEAEVSARRLVRVAGERVRVGGRPARLHGVEEGKAEVVFVIDPALDPWLQAMEERVPEHRLGDFASLGPDGRLRLLGPRAAPLSGEQLTAAMFRGIAPGEPLGNLLLSGLEAKIPELPVHFADSVALAGLEAQASNRRRAVVLLLGEPRADGSLFEPAAVRSFLQLLQVPLQVWSTVGKGAHPEWGEAIHLPVDPDSLHDTGPLRTAMRGLRRALDDQRIVWLEGQHLPQSVSVVPGPAEIFLAGAQPKGEAPRSRK